MALNNSFTTDSLFFDTRTNTVMSAGNSKDNNLKDLIARVRKFWTSNSNDDIMLALEYYNHDVDLTIKAFKKDGAQEALNEWNVSKQSTSKKRRQKNKKADQQPAEIKQKNINMNGDGKRNGSTDSSVHVSDTKPEIKLNNSAPTQPHEEIRKKAKESRMSAGRNRTESEKLVPINFVQRAPHAGLEKTWKDLQRIAASLQHVKANLSEVAHTSSIEIRDVFRSLHDELNEREAQLQIEVDRVKMDGQLSLKTKNTRVLELKAKCDRSATLTDRELTMLRNDVKHFVNDRSAAEQLAHATKFNSDKDEMIKLIKRFGHVNAIKDDKITKQGGKSSSEEKNRTNYQMPSFREANDVKSGPKQIYSNNQAANDITNHHDMNYMPQASIALDQFKVMTEINQELTVEKKNQAENIAEKILNSLSIGQNNNAVKSKPKEQQQPRRPKSSAQQNNKRSPKSKSPDKSPRKDLTSDKNSIKPSIDGISLDANSNQTKVALPQRSPRGRGRGGGRGGINRKDIASPPEIQTFNGMTNGI